MYKQKKWFFLSALATSISITFVNSAVAKDNELIVTASKQSQYAASSQNVASFIVNSSQLEDANVTDTKDLPKVLPGLFIAGNSENLLQSMISIRGASTGQDFYNPGVQIYVDGIPQSTAAMMQPLLDVSSVQLLKGPQGTLYGKAATGGVIDIITQKPDSNYRGYISGGYGIRNDYRGKFNISGSIYDGVLYGSISGLREVEKGRISNPGTGSKNLGGTADNMGSIRLRLAPDNQNWEINTSYTGECVDSTQGLAIKVIDHNPAKTNPIINSGDANGGNSPDPKFRRCINTESVSGKYNTDNWLFSAISSWDQIKINWYTEEPYHNLRQANDRWLENTQELRAATQGAGHVIDAVMGIYHNTSQRNESRKSLKNNFIPVGNIDYSFIETQSFAVYTDLTYHVTSSLDLGAGIRASHDIAKTKLPDNSIFSTSENNVLGQISTGYQLNKNNRFYARIAQGYKPVSYFYIDNTSKKLKPNKPERSISYEIGHKYNSDKLNLQSDIYYTSTHGLISAKAIGPWEYANTNLGDANAFGVEIDGSYYFVPGWQIGANASITHSKFDDDIKRSTTYANRRVPLVPNFNAGIYINGTINTPAGMINPYIGFNAVGSYTFGDYDFKQKAYTTTDIRIAWQATDRINLSAYVNNIFDQRYFLFADTRFGFDYGYANIGRTAGIDLKIALF